MCRNILLLTMLGLGLFIFQPRSEAGKSQRSLAAIVADLKKGEKESQKAIQELETWDLKAAIRTGEKPAAAISGLVDLLTIKNEDVRLAVTFALGRIGAPAVDPLSKVLASKEDTVRFYAVWSLGLIGPKAVDKISAVIKALEKDSAADVRRKAAFALGNMDPEGEMVVGPLVAALGDRDADVRQSAATSLPKISKVAVPALITALKSEKIVQRTMAMQTLGAIGAAAAPAIPELKRIVQQAEMGVAEHAADALAGIGEPALLTLKELSAEEDEAVRSLTTRSLGRIGAPAVTTLVDLLGAKHVDIRRFAAAQLGNVPVNDKMVIIGLGFAAAKDKDYQVRRNALQSLRNHGPGAKLAEPYITALLIDIDPQLRVEAFHTLQNLGVDPRPGLKKALGHKDPTIRINTASLMAALNLEVTLAEPVLLEGLKEKDKALKMQAAHALSLRGLQEDVVLPIFVEGLKNDLASVRRQAAEAIARYGTKGRKAASALIETLDDADDGVRAQALATLRGVGEEPKKLLPAMVKILRRKTDNLHDAAAQVVFQVGPDAIGDIITLLKKDDAPALRLACLRTLAMVGPPAKDAVGELIKGLADPEARTRMTAARALGNIGPDAKAALEALGKAEKDTDPNVRQVAKAARDQIRADANQKEFQVHGVLTPGDPFDRVRQGCYHVVHTYSMKAGQSYTIDLISDTGPQRWDNFLRLENAKGEQLAADDDSGGNLNARIHFRAPQDGWYRIIVTSFAPRASGPYTLRIR